MLVVKDKQKRFQKPVFTYKDAANKNATCFKSIFKNKISAKLE